MLLILAILFACRPPPSPDCGEGGPEKAPDVVDVMAPISAHPGLVLPYNVASREHWLTSGGDLATRCSFDDAPTVRMMGEWTYDPVYTARGSFIVGHFWLDGVEDANDATYDGWCVAHEDAHDQFRVQYRVYDPPAVTSVDPSAHELTFMLVCSEATLTLEGVDVAFFVEGGIITVVDPESDEVGYIVHAYASWPQSLQAGDPVIVTAIDAWGDSISAEMTFPELPED